MTAEITVASCAVVCSYHKHMVTAGDAFYSADILCTATILHWLGNQHANSFMTDYILTVLKFGEPILYMCRVNEWRHVKRPT